MSNREKLWEQQLEKGYLDFYPFGIEGITDIFWARNYFFYTLKKLVPNAIEDLHKMIPIFSSLLEEFKYKGPSSMGSDFQYEKKTYDLNDILKSFNDKPSDIALMFVKILSEWSQRYNFNGEEDIWVINEVPRVLSMWINEKNYRDELTFKYVGNYPLDKLMHETEKASIEKEKMSFRKFTIPYPVYMYNKQEYLRLCEQYYDEQIENYKKIGYTPSKSKYQFEHFEWLVLYKVKNYTYKDIMLRYNIVPSDGASPNTIIGRQVKKLAELIGLNLKKNNRGRPRSVK